MLIKRDKKLFMVYNGKEILFRSCNFDECVIWVNQNGGFNETRKKIKSIIKKAG